MQGAYGSCAVQGTPPAGQRAESGLQLAHVLLALAPPRQHTKRTICDQGCASAAEYPGILLHSDLTLIAMHPSQCAAHQPQLALSPEYGGTLLLRGLSRYVGPREVVAHLTATMRCLH